VEQRVIALLQKKGLNVTAVQLPLTSLDDDIAVASTSLLTGQGWSIHFVAPRDPHVYIDYRFHDERSVA
jgi:hypothetical protein